MIGYADLLFVCLLIKQIIGMCFLYCFCGRILDILYFYFCFVLIPCLFASLKLVVASVPSGNFHLQKCSYLFLLTYLYICLPTCFSSLPANLFAPVLAYLYICLLPCFSSLPANLLVSMLANKDSSWLLTCQHIRLKTYFSSLPANLLAYLSVNLLSSSFTNLLYIYIYLLIRAWLYNSPACLSNQVIHVANMFE